MNIVDNIEIKNEGKREPVSMQVTISQPPSSLPINIPKTSQRAVSQNIEAFKKPPLPQIIPQREKVQILFFFLLKKLISTIDEIARNMKKFCLKKFLKGKN